MDLKLFTLRNAENLSEVFAVGVSIVSEEGDEEAVIYRRDPDNRGSTFGVHASPEAACKRFGLILPLEVVWQRSGEDYEPDIPAEPDPRSHPGRSRTFYRGRMDAR